MSVVHNRCLSSGIQEADRLQMIVDRYNDVFTLQVLTQAWAAPERKAGDHRRTERNCLR